ncbi:MAG: ABC transporter permease [Acidimicrobiales bacterium]
MSRVAWRVLPAAAAFAALFGAWELLVRLRNVKRVILPPPSAIAADIWTNAGQWRHDAWVTGYEAALGLAVAATVAIGLAVLITHSRLLERALLPVVAVVQVTPVLALAVPLAVWLGLGLAPRVVMAALITFVPLLVNAVAGFRAIDRDTFELMQSVSASRTEVFFKLRVPYALPYLFAAVRVCVGLALIGALVSEWNSSSRGLGNRMIRAQNQLLMTKVWAAVFVLMIMGLIGTGLVTALEKRVLRWHAGAPAA